MGTKISALPNRATVQDTDLLVVADFDEGTNYKTSVSEFISGKGIITADTIDDNNIVTLTTNPLSGRSVFSGLGIPIGTPSTPLLTVACGNSITTACQYVNSSGVFPGNPAADGGYWTPKCELQLANMLSDAPMDFQRITSGTRIDAFGVYGYSGQTLATINADLATNFFTPLATASKRPQLVVGHALLENDIAAAATYAEIKSRLDTWLAHVRATWPGVRILLCTPRPSFSNDSGAKVAAFQYAVTYTKSLDNSFDVFVSDVSIAYQDPSNPGVPLSGYTDASVHPLPKGAVVNARIIASTLRRIVPVVLRDWTMLSANAPLSGSVSVAGTRVTGTGPTGSTVGTPAVGTAAVSAANSPGWSLSYNVAANATPLDLGTINIGYVSSATTAGNLGEFVKLRLVSGAENIRSIEAANRQTMDVGNDWRYLVRSVTSDADCGAWEDGDELTLAMPLFPPTTGRTITGVSPYLRFYGNLTGGSFAAEILAIGNRTA